MVFYLLLQTNLPLLAVTTFMKYKLLFVLV